MAAVYCTEKDLYDHGMPRGSVPNPAKLIPSVLASTDTFTLDEHGFQADDAVSFRGQGAGAAMPAPLVAGVTYYVVPLVPASDYAFKVALTPSGAAVDLTSDGTNVLVIAPLPKAQAIAWASRIVDDIAPAHVVPFVLPVPEIVRMTTAEIAAWKLAARSGPVSKSLSEIVDAARKRLERWGTGVPVRGENAPPAANLAASVTAPISDSQGWAKFGGIL